MRQVPRRGFRDEEGGEEKTKIVGGYACKIAAEQWWEDVGDVVEAPGGVRRGVHEAKPKRQKMMM